MSDQAKISLNIRGMSLEIVGSEAFVSEQIGHFRDAIQAALAGEAQAEEEPPEGSTQPPAAPPKEHAGTPKYTNVLHVEGDNVRILKTIPGTTTSKKAVNTALVYLWAKRNAGSDPLPFTEIRDVCQQLGCLDKPNFAKHMKSARQWIIIEGVKGSSAQTAKLTVPGVERAKELLEELNADNKGAQNP
jgi:hypothetical protein